MGYVHDTGCFQFIPPTAIHCVTGTWTWTAGQVAGTISRHKAANAETAVVTVPVMLPSSATPQHGAYLESLDLDYELTVAAATSVTASCNSVARGANTAVAVVTAQTVTQSLTAATTAATADQHKLTVTLSTPVWIDDNVYLLVAFDFVCAAGTVVDILGAFAHFTLRQ